MSLNVLRCSWVVLDGFQKNLENIIFVTFHLEESASHPLSSARGVPQVSKSTWKVSKSFQKFVKIMIFMSCRAHQIMIEHEQKQAQEQEQEQEQEQ